MGSSDDPVPVYHRAGGALLRAAAVPLTQMPTRWPPPEDLDGCMAWLVEAWRLPGFAAAVGQASTDLADRVDAIVAGRAVRAGQVRRAVAAVVRYALRAVGRPTPFGLFAGVATATVGDRATVRWSGKHHAVVRADTQWLADIVMRLEASPELLERLDVVVTDLAIRRGGRLEAPLGPDRVTVGYTPAVRAVRDAATTPVRFCVLADKLVDAFAGADRAAVCDMLAALVRQGILITNLRAPMTVVDPLEHLVDQLRRAGAACLPATAALCQQVTAVADEVSRHNDSTHGGEQERIRAALTSRMRAMSTAGRSPLAVDLRLGCQVQIPHEVVAEMQRAAGLLLRLTRRPAGEPVWQAYHAAFCGRYGTGVLVPVSEVVDPDAGLGYPAGYPGSVWPVPAGGPTERDELLLALALQAAADGADEIVLDDQAVRALTAGDDFDPRYAPPHVEIAARIQAASVEALDRGEFTLRLAPARSAGTLTSRFTTTASGCGLHEVYATVPSCTQGALAVQMSFPPMYPHAENICRVPAYLPHVLSLGEHRDGGDTARIIGVDDLAITATRRRLHLVSVSRRQVLEPQVFHALALQKQPPPLARFLAHLTRAFGATWHEFDWGPHAHRLPWLPRIRHGRAVLSPARWRLTTADLPTAEGQAWPEALGRWRQRWRCPDTVELRDADRTLRITLTEPAHLAHLRAQLERHGEANLTETVASGDGYGWLDGHAHEIAIPLIRTEPAAPAVSVAAMPLVTNREPGHLPAAPTSTWLYAKLYTHPERIDEIITSHLPQLLSALEGEPMWWFVRYRSPAETDHLRLRIHTPSQQQSATCLAAIGAWARHLSDKGAIGRMVLDTYQPEIGRYGDGEAMRAAEAVFAADSAAVAAGLRLLPAATIHRTAMVAIGMVDIVEAFLGSRPEAASWLVAHRVPVPVAADRTTADQVTQWAINGTLPHHVPWPPALAQARQIRADSLTVYRHALPDNADTDAVLAFLLHMHHNRAAGIDPDGEANCRRLARQAALAWRAHHPGEHP